MPEYENYHETRFGFDKRRRVLWQTLVRHCFQEYVPHGGAVLELGAGYCDFINSVKSEEKFALDLWPGFTEYADPDVQTIVGDLTAISQVPDNHFDLIFASNLFEHVTQTALAGLLVEARRKLKRGGKLIAVQPNFRFCAPEYFDDYTHVCIWSHVSFGDFLGSNGFEVERVVPRFLPLTIKSRLPVSKFLIRLYLISPIKPLGKQMMLVAHPVE